MGVAIPAFMATGALQGRWQRPLGAVVVGREGRSVRRRFGDSLVSLAAAAAAPARALATVGSTVCAQSARCEYSGLQVYCN